MKKNVLERQTHPAEKSLSIFPLVPKKKTNLVAAGTPYNSSSCSKSSFNQRKLCHKIQIHFNCSPTNVAQKRGKIDDSFEDTHIHATKVKLQCAEKHLPVIEGNSAIDNSDSLKLPPIPLLSQMPPSIQKVKKRVSKDVLLKPCTCGKLQNGEKKTLSKQLDDMKMKEIARTFRSDETPRMFSIYVRWKHYRDGSADYDYRSLLDTFQTFGTLSNIVFKSRNSAVIVFKETESACTAAKVFHSVGREMKLYVRWLNEL